MPTPTVKRLQLGHELRHLRERAGASDKEAAEVLERSHATVSRIENGVTGIRQGDLRRLVGFYVDSIEDDEPVDVDELVELNKGSESRGRWRGFRSTYPKWFRRAVDMEADAASMWFYRAEMILGLCQTKAYMEALFTSAKVRKEDQQTRNTIKARLERQQVLTKEDAPDVTYVMSQSCVERVIGTPQIMREQMHHLVELAERPNIHIQVLPFRCRTAPPSVTFPFAMFEIPAFRSKTTPPLKFVYVEQFTNADYLDGLTDVAEYTGLWNGLLGAALDPVESRDFLLEAAERY